MDQVFEGSSLGRGFSFKHYLTRHYATLARFYRFPGNPLFSDSLRGCFSPLREFVYGSGQPTSERPWRGLGRPQFQLSRRRDP
jgi:hypothetical protein